MESGLDRYGLQLNPNDIKNLTGQAFKLGNQPVARDIWKGGMVTVGGHKGREDPCNGCRLSQEVGTQRYQGMGEAQTPQCVTHV